MCTFSWDIRKDSCVVFFNRDEKKSRDLAKPLQFTEISGERKLLHPVDSEKGGTWIAVSSSGILTCLLNLYEHPIPTPPEEGFDSRGWLVMKMAESPNESSAIQQMKNTDCRKYPPFHLFQIDSNRQKIWSFEWTGKNLKKVDHPAQCLHPATGSSYRNNEVCEHRIHQFHSMISETDPDRRRDQLQAFHQYEELSPYGSHGVRMMRDDAQTVSFSKILVTSETIEFSYQSRELNQCEYNEAQVVRLGRD